MSLTVKCVASRGGRVVHLRSKLCFSAVCGAMPAEALRGLKAQVSAGDVVWRGWDPYPLGRGRGRRRALPACKKCEVAMEKDAAKREAARRRSGAVALAALEKAEAALAEAQARYLVAHGWSESENGKWHKSPWHDPKQPKRGERVVLVEQSWAVQVQRINT